MEWVLTGNLVALREQFNERFPQRSKVSDGTIGDPVHAKRKSGHNDEASGMAEYDDGDRINEVRALDITTDLNDTPHGAIHAQTMTDVIEELLHTARYDVDFPLEYIIYDRYIYHVDDRWIRRNYQGTDPHTGHAHFSGRQTQKADNARNYDYGFSRLGIPGMNEKSIWDHILSGTTTARNALKSLYDRIPSNFTARMDSIDNKQETHTAQNKINGDKLNAANAKLNLIGEQLDTLTAKIDHITRLVETEPNS